ncbi:efflux transporter outer membrane subunit [Herbaspirillum sp. RTI4]|uniref:efflux transporter outer membrane subunit n=1 Tax=Herbaspirillum sp. RTI4 TaxID=3048640 RepID=UPI002AB3F867|nr:efflux transporter outer membrane subunit [Herbaspirillum sp. RTI4]MDY7578897.1 efflux transporter outer membrane subunit [Herbaspirillum sp. RTI4]MEA9981986.1 efflux transporter outer membrane subunit [Herbaspirillum sp. RTI4]
MAASTLGLAGCASFNGIHSDKQIAKTSDFATEQSLASEKGEWPRIDWAGRFGDPQLSALIEEALANNPSLQQAQARIAAAGALAESKGAPLLPTVDAQASVIRNRFSESSIYPPPYGGGWYNDKVALVHVGYELDLWGKNRSALDQALSREKAAQASGQEVRLTIAATVASVYNQLAALYTQQTILTNIVTQRSQLQSITKDRVTTGLDPQSERNQSRGTEADARAQLVENEGQIVLTRQQLGALLGKGPDRGLQIATPHLNEFISANLPEQLPLNLLGRRPDIVAARWQVEAAQSGISVAKAKFYPDINLSASYGFDSLLSRNPFTAASRSINLGPAISLPLFEGGALRANLKGEYATYELSVANYNQTLNDAFADVAHQIAAIHSIQRQLPIRREAINAAESVWQSAQQRFRIGLVSKLAVLNAETAFLAQQQLMAALQANSRALQIGLIKALGGGFDAQQSGLALAAQPSGPE